MIFLLFIEEGDRGRFITININLNLTGNARIINVLQYDCEIYPK